MDPQPANVRVIDPPVIAFLTNISRSELWPTSCLVIQPFHHRTWTRHIIRKREKAETVKLLADDLITRALGISPGSAGQSRFHQGDFLAMPSSNILRVAT
jgi:hypothetical protein